MKPLERLLAPSLNKRPDAVLFDWDDTLANSNKHLHELSMKLIQEYGKEPYPTPDAMNRLWTESKELCCKTYFPGHSVNEISKAWAGYMREVPPEKLELQPETIEVLETLKNKGIPMLLVSNKTPDVLKLEVEHFGLSHYFEAIVGGDEDYRKRKPNPLPIVKALGEANEKREKRREKRLGLGNLWFIGDHPIDAGAARSDGIQRFIVGEKHHDYIRSRFEDNDPSGGIIYLKNLNEFSDIVKNIPAPHGFREL